MSDVTPIPISQPAPGKGRATALLDQTLRHLARVYFFAGFSIFIWIFSQWPRYSVYPADQALVTISLSHAGQRRVPCRKRTEAELAALAANMRRPDLCQRERLPIFIGLTLDGVALVETHASPSGLSKDGMSTLYRRFPIVAGAHSLHACLRDSARDSGCDFERSATIHLRPGQRFVVDFSVGQGGFLFTGLPSMATQGQEQKP